MSRNVNVCSLLIGLVSIGFWASAARAFGPEGHLIAGYIAAPQLCTAARAEIAALAGNQPFEELGLWADRNRSDPAWEHSAPWHYMNIEIAEGAGLRDAEAAARAYRHPPEGDVLWAIERFSTMLTDRALPKKARAEALRFLVHFVVDIHQPLHVGRAADRGGNTIDVRYGTTVTNLHRFWDTDVIKLRDLSALRYARYLPALDPNAPANGPPTWAAESLMLRPLIYAGLDGSGVRPLSADYLQDAQSLIEHRLVQAGHRLASTLNRLLCR
jgi:hypothetical protein